MPLTIESAIVLYQKAVHARRFRATRRTEKYYFPVFLKYMRKMGVKYVGQITFKHLEMLQAYCLSDVTVQTFANGKTRTFKKRSASSVNRMFSCYRAFLKKLYDWEEIKRNPAEKIKKLPERTTKRELWPQKHLSQMLDTLPAWAGDAIYLIAETGVRPGEMGRLTFGDINIDKKLLTFSSFKGGGDERQRLIPMSDQLFKFLVNKCKLPHEKTDFVFLNSKGRPVTANNLAKAVRRSRRELGLDHQITPYGLRHTYITMLVELNIHMKKVKALAGHVRDETTNKYIHLKADQLAAVVSEVEQNRSLKR